MELAPLISALLDPASYPSPKGPVELVQTHISYILLTPDFAYKIKKPVDFGFLDFTTLKKRRRFCEEEVRLNRRLAPNIYLGVVKVTKEDGAFRMEGEGGAVEYAVKMKRIPEESILEHRLAEGAAGAEDIKKIAGVIASFHAHAESGPRISSFGSPATIARNTGENFAQTKDFIGKTISKRLYALIKKYTEGFLKEHKNLFIRRMEEGFIRDCHGDIHCEHISTDNGVNIFDCIEFNERFRFSDVVADAAFLSMDLDFHNRHGLALAFDEAYFNASGDGDGPKLLGFYKCYRAYVRGKVEGFKSTEPEVDEAEKRRAVICARRHFHLAGLYASGGYRPMLLVVRGLSGTGKSTVAGAVSRETGFPVLASDRVRKELAGIPPGERRPERFAEGIYSTEFTEKTYAELMKRASTLLAEGSPVILDATFPKARLIEAAQLVAIENGADFHVLECAAPDGAVKERMEKRHAGETQGAIVSDADWEIFLRQKEVYERWAGAVELDTTSPPDCLVSTAAAQIFS